MDGVKEGVDEIERFIKLKVFLMMCRRGVFGLCVCEACLWIGMEFRDLTEWKWGDCLSSGEIVGGKGR